MYSPSSEVNTAGDNQARDAWVLGPKGIDPGPIDVSHVSGPVLAVAGAQDSLWGSARSANAIILQLSADHSRYKDQALIYQGAGHGVGMQPYQPVGNTALFYLGGTRAGNVAAQRDGWPKMLALLAGLTAAAG